MTRDQPEQHDHHGHGGHGHTHGAVDPVQEASEEHHRIAAHSHDGLPTHSH